MNSMPNADISLFKVIDVVVPAVGIVSLAVCVCVIPAATVDSVVPAVDVVLAVVTSAVAPVMPAWS